MHDFRFFPTNKWPKPEQTLATSSVGISACGQRNNEGKRRENVRNQTALYYKRSAQDGGWKRDALDASRPRAFYYTLDPESRGVFPNTDDDESSELRTLLCILRGPPYLSSRLRGEERSR